MAVLNDLANTKQTTSVGGAPTQNINAGGGANIQTGKNIDNTAALIRDIGGKTVEGIQQFNRASKYAGEVAGLDNLTEYKKDMDTINANYENKPDLTSSDMADKNIAEDAVYKEYLSRGSFGDNAEANDAFKRVYGNPATNLLFKSKTKNESARSTLFLNETKRMVEDTVRDTGNLISADATSILRKNIKDANGNPDIVDDYVAVNRNLDFNRMFHDDNKLFVGEGFQEQVNEYYGSMIKLTDEGYVRVDGKLTDKAFQAMINNINGKAAQITGANGFRDNTDYVEANTKAGVTHADGRLTSEENMLAIGIEHGHIMASENVSNSVKATMNEKYEQTIVDQLKIQQMNAMFDDNGNPINIEEIKDVTMNGQYFTSNYTLEGFEDSISPTLATAVVQAKLTDTEAVMDDMTIDNDNDIQTFAAQLEKSKNLSHSISASEPDFYAQYKAVLTEKNAKSMDRSGLYKQKAWMEHSGYRFKFPVQYRMLRDMTSEIDGLDPKKDKTEIASIVRSTNGRLSAEATHRRSSFSDMKSLATPLVEDISDRWIELDAEVSNSVINKITEIAHNNGLNEDEATEWIKNKKSNEAYIDLSRNRLGMSGLGEDITLVLPDGYTRNDGEGVISNITRAWNKDNENLEAGDLQTSVTMTDVDGKQEIAYDFYINRGGKRLRVGSLNSDTLKTWKKLSRRLEAEAEVVKKKASTKTLDMTQQSDTRIN